MADEKEYRLTNFKIGKTFESSGINKKTGKNWTLISFYTDHSRAEGKKFSKFVNPEEPETWPHEGAEVKEMVFVVVKRGKYENYDVKKMTYVQQPSGAETSQEMPPWEEGTTPSTPPPSSEPEAPGIVPGQAIATDKHPIWACLNISAQVVLGYLKGGTERPDIHDTADQIVRLAVHMYKDTLTDLNRIGEE